MLRKVSFILALLLLMSSLGSYAAEYSFGYTIGEEYYNVELDEFVFGEKYEFYLPFDSEYIEITYVSANNAFLNVTVNDVIQLSHTATEGENQALMYFESIVRKGDCDLKLNSDGEIAVESIVFYKVPETVSYSGPEGFTAAQRPVINFTEYEDAVRTAVIVNVNSPVIKVNGADRYINYDDLKEVPYREDGITYLPIKTFAQAFGYYYEDDYANDYFLLRSENIEFVHKNGCLYRQVNYGEYAKITNNTLTKYGVTYIPIQYYAEAVGKTVLFKDDFIVADQRDLAKEIVSDKIFASVKADMERYIPSGSTGTTYYVSQSASADDENPGTQAEPFATLEKACEEAQAGDTVIIGSGVYREILEPQNSGTANNPIVFRADEGADVVISALEEIGNPDYEENGLWVYDMDWDMGNGRNQIFYKTEALAEGRHPNSHTSPRYYPLQLELSPLWPTQGNIQVVLEGSADTAVSETDLIQQDGYWTGATLVSMHGSGYGVATAKITDSEQGKLYLGKKSTRLWHKSGGSDAEDHFDFGYITDSLNTVDTPGEWFWGDGKLYVYPIDQESRLSLELEAKRRQITVDLSESEYVHLVGINTVGGGMKLNNSRMCVINGGTHKYISHHTYTDDTESGFIDTRDSVSDIYDENAAIYRGETGIYIGGRNNAVINTEISYSASGGICLAGAYSYIENNLLSECGYMGSGINGIYLFDLPAEDITIVKGGHTLYNNTVDKTGRASLNLSSWTYPLAESRGLVPWVASEIAYNEFLNANVSTRDCGAVYAYGSILGDEQKKLQFHHNLVGSQWVSDGYGAGIYWDNWSQMVECYNNIVFYNNSRSITDNYLHIASQTKYPTKSSYVNEWNNTDAGYKLLGKESLSQNDYPLNKWFATGYNPTGNETVNNNVTFSGIYDVPKKLISGENAVIGENNGVCLVEANQEICIENVDFGDCCEKIKLLFFGDRYNTGDKILISVGENDYAEVMVNCTSSERDTVNELVIPIEECSGIQNLYIKCAEYKSAEILGMYTCIDEKSVNNKYSMKITSDDDYYYFSGQFPEEMLEVSNSVVFGTVTEFENNQIQCLERYEVGEGNSFELVFEKPEYSGIYRFNIFVWDGSNLKPIATEERYVYAENKYRDAYEKTKFIYADEYPQLISDNTAVITYGKNDVVLFKNVDFRGGEAKTLSLKYGMNDSEEGKLTIKVYIDNTETEPVLTITPEGTGERWNRQEFAYEIGTENLLDGTHDLYFVFEGRSSLPMHLMSFCFGE